MSFSWHGYATFGQRYRTETHPTLGPHGHPDGVVEIFAPDLQKARAIITGLTLDTHGDGPPVALYSDLYLWPATAADLERFEHRYPRGPVLLVTCRPLLRTVVV